MTTPDPTQTQDEAKKPDATQLLLDNLGGPSGMIYTAVPVVAFVVANALVALPVAVGSAVAIALVITVIRMRRGEPIMQAIGGLIGVAAAGGVAAWTGSAGGYFLIGIWTSLVGAAIMVASLLARRPLTGLLWNALHGNKYKWRKDRSVLRAHDVATLTFAALFGARYIVQDWLYDTDATGWLAFAKIAMGTPLFALAILVTVWAYRRSTKHFEPKSH
ncbi:DUF3159 domain-containing protein [Rhodococcoides kyotonense]|uniref:DUF3159 domain-containing protein n=1 Tax=Rhodococcoides kyotonense TaxID=398843 RepID=A0A239MRM7_9NOCA|nr:DUF3159 domain-containing protein [Rhodococcus kyotonensis]SNT45477.1 Protein of unknown function [Rhodococcus kyotonensis]